MGEDTGEQAEPRARGVRRRQLPVWQETILLLVLALGLAILLKAFFVQAFYIPSASMVPGLQGGPGYPADDRVLVEKPSYWFGGPHRGDVVVFSDPGGWLGSEGGPAPTGLASLLGKVGLSPSGDHLVKRVIGVPGDTVHCCDDAGRIEINGKAVDESGFLNHAPGPGACDAPIDQNLVVTGSPLRAPCDWTIGPIPAGDLFVLGDNRADSRDARSHLCPGDADTCGSSPWIREDDVVGRVFAVVWPVSRWAGVGRPSAFDGVPAAPGS